LTGRPKEPGVVAVAMSGGVDSSVAAAILKAEGREIFGVTMDLFALPARFCVSDELRNCCGRKAREDAAAVAAKLGIRHYVADFKREFEARVIADFCAEYGAGRTPNPCVRCNQFIKFGLLFERAARLGAKAVATGHYARIERDADTGRWLLRKGLDPDKDQSYFLHTLTQAELGRSLFPLGGLKKTEVRSLALASGLPVAKKTESQEICFIPDDDYAGFLGDRCPAAFEPGPIADPSGRVIGRHKGVAHFTVGQRKGMGIASPHPLYVVKVDVERNTIVAGPSEALYARSLEATGLNWISIEELSGSLAVRARVRYKHAEAPARVEAAGEDRVRVEFEKPQRAIAPGQSVVFYDGDIVVGGGTIERAEL
jgi:tRNA-specific 2-thiouridylase